MRNTASSFLALLLVACGGTAWQPYEDPPGRVAIAPVSGSSNALTAVSGCDTLLTELRERESAIMEASIEANRQYALRVSGDRDGNCYDPNDDGSDCFLFFCEERIDLGAAEDAAAPRGQNKATTGAKDYSTTNNQVAGVDEADYIKNDANTIYMTADDRLLIFDAWPAQSAHLIANVELTGEPERIFVHGNRLVVLSDTGDPMGCGWDPYYGSYSTAQTLQLTVWDITHLDAPVLERRTQVSGTYVAARLIEGIVHVVVEFPDIAASPFETWPESLPRNLCNDDFSRRRIDDAFDDLLAENLAAIQSLGLAHFLPGYVDEDLIAGSVATVNEELFASCDDFYAADQTLSNGYLSLLSFATSDDTTMGATTVFGRFGEVYASHQSLYVAVKEFVTDPGESWQSGWSDTQEHTLVHKFALATGGEAATYRGSGAVPGTIINQFAMDEHQDRLRIATTEWADWERSNSVWVLEDTGGSLTTVGQVRNIAPTEDIRAVRFDGDRGFLVTFRQTDPLFTFDLSDPYAPRMVGELHIPGFSTYMHFMDPDHLLTIGFDATDAGQFRGVMLQIFDVSTMTAPTLTHREIIGTRGSMSDATDDHLAFNYFPSRDLLAIPMAICESDRWDAEVTFNGLMVYDVTAQDGFRFVGGVDHRDGTTNSHCGNWWTDPDSQVRRSVFMEDYVYSFSNTKLKVSSLSDIDAPFLTFNLPASDWQGAPACDPWVDGWR